MSSAGDLERLFELVVTRLHAASPARLLEPLAINELLRTVVPYRSARQPLAIATSEDYEHLVLRFVAGEGALAMASPPEALARLRAEALCDNPDLHVLRQEAEATIVLSRDRVQRLLAGRSGQSFAPPKPEPAPAPVTSHPLAETTPDWPETPAEPTEAAWEGTESAATCAYCGGSLPQGRIVNFCPHCGQQLAELRCPRCHSAVEYGWRHCVGCGTELANP